MGNADCLDRCCALDHDTQPHFGLYASTRDDSLSFLPETSHNWHHRNYPNQFHERYPVLSRWIADCITVPSKMDMSSKDLVHSHPVCNVQWGDRIYPIYALGEPEMDDVIHNTLGALLGTLPLIIKDILHSPR